MVMKVSGDFMMEAGRKYPSKRCAIWLADTLQGMGATSKAFRQFDFEGGVMVMNTIRCISALCM
jgi:hypothetical protein